jgi:hypothetical protein
MPQVVSTLKHWHGFAFGVLDYEATMTLPPRNGVDVCRWACLFSNAGTAQNYVSNLRWVCTFIQEGLLWDTDSLKQLIKGIKASQISQLATSTLKTRVILTNKALQALVAKADAEGKHEIATKAVFCWSFLPRVQSEASPAQVGTTEDVINLSPDRHSAVWLDVHRKTVVWRLQRRKNRPNGSLLRRCCDCASTRFTAGAANAEKECHPRAAEHPEDFCVFHRMAYHMQGKARAQSIWSVTPTQFLHELKKLLSSLGETRAESLTLKAFRAGKATAMAAAGHGLGAILEAGEWRSKAFLKYVEVDTFDQSLLFKECVDTDTED